MSVEINCDMGEAFSIYKCGDDEGLMPLITVANVACGFHASDPTVMKKTVDLAKKHGVRVGAHPSFPDRQGFGRRVMAMRHDDLVNCIVYQVGALKGFLDLQGMPLNHIKPHGALYTAAAKDEKIAEAIADAVALFDVPIMGMPGTVHEKVYTARGLKFLAEYYTDLQYDDEGHLILTVEHDPVDPEQAAANCLRVIREGKAPTVNGRDIPMRADTICVHSDTPGAVELARTVRDALQPYLA